MRFGFCPANEAWLRNQTTVAHRVCDHYIGGYLTRVVCYVSRIRSVMGPRVSIGFSIRRTGRNAMRKAAPFAVELPIVLNVVGAVFSNACLHTLFALRQVANVELMRSLV